VTDRTHVTSFGHLQVEFDDRVLRPRDWTRQQSAWAAELLEQLPDGDVLELCAGVGHIGLLTIAGTSRHLVQVDADGTASWFAQVNASRAGAATAAWSVEVRHGWLEEALKPDERFALVIADPPWVRSDDTSRHPEDPLSAIDGGSDGLDGARSCLEVTGRHLLPGGAAVLQVGDRAQAEAVAAYVDRRPALGLQVVEHRVAEAGALVHLSRRDPFPA
jgi:methylase of polypeptide subunit release factors